MPTNKIIYGPGRIPKASEFAIGEIIINLDDSKVYSKNKQNVVFELVGEAGDGFKNVYLSSLFESGSLRGNPLSVTQGTTGLSGSEGFDVDTYFNSDLVVGGIIKIVSGAFSTFHEITSISSNTRANFTPSYQNNTVNVGDFGDTDIIIMDRNLSGSLLVTSSLSNRNLIFSGSSGVKITTGSEPQSIEISIDGTAIAPQSNNIQGTLFTLNDTTGQTGIDFIPDGAIESGDTISAFARGLGTSDNVQFGTINVGNLTSNGIITFSGLDNVTTENHVLVYNDGNNEIDYIPTSSLIPLLQEEIVTAINPYDPLNIDGDDSTQARVGGIDNATTIPVGTSLEKILRDILVETIEASITDITVKTNGTAQLLPLVAGEFEIGDNDLDGAKIFDLSYTQDSNGNDFDNYSLTLKGNQLANGSDNNSVSSLSVQTTATIVRLTVGSDIDFLRISPGLVEITGSGTSNTPNYTSKKSISLPFNFPIFCGGSNNILSSFNNNVNSATLNIVLADISGSGPTTGLGNANSQESVEYGTQTLFSYKNVDTLNFLGTNTPSTSKFPIAGGPNGSLKILSKYKHPFTGAEANPHPSTLQNYYTYIVYPSTYGVLGQIDLPGGSSNELTAFEGPLGPISHTRFGISTDYYVYRSLGDGIFNNTNVNSSIQIYLAS